MTLDELLDQGFESTDPNVNALARKVKQQWDEGVTPSVKQLRQLTKILEDFNAPCSRLTDEGKCDGWLVRYHQDCRIPASAPFFCPFAARTDASATFPQCPGYRTIRET